MSYTNEIRTEILKAIAARIETLWGPAGTVSKKLRAVKNGRWQPKAQPAPCATVTDDGQRASETWRGDDGADSRAAGSATQQMTLAVCVLLELPAQWDRDDGGAGWTDFIERLRADLTNWRDASLGVIECRYSDDSPWQAVLQSGGSLDVWTINFDVEYVTACSLEAP